MADQNTKTISLPKQERKGSPPAGIGFFDNLESFIGSAMGDTVDIFARGEGSFVNEVPINQMPEHRIGQDRPPIGGQTEIPFNNPDQALYQQVLEGVNVKKEEVSEANKILHQSVREVAGKSDEELAEIERYNNEGYRGENLRSRHGLLEAVKNLFEDLFNKSKEKVSTPFQKVVNRISSKGAISGGGNVSERVDDIEGGGLVSPGAAAAGRVG